MSDGPFKNLKLAKRWRQFVEAAYNDAFDQVECRNMASHAIVQDVLTEPNQALMSVLKLYVAKNQIEIDPLASIEKIFNEYSKDQFAVTVRKEMSYRLSDNCTESEALGHATASALGEQINISRSRIQEECIYSCEIGEMKQNQLDRTIDRTNKIFETLDRQSICKAILASNKQAFKDAVAKKDGLDEGPCL